MSVCLSSLSVRPGDCLSSVCFGCGGHGHVSDDDDDDGDGGKSQTPGTKTVDGTVWGRLTNPFDRRSGHGVKGVDSTPPLVGWRVPINTRLVYAFPDLPPTANPSGVNRYLPYISLS